MLVVYYSAVNSLWHFPAEVRHRIWSQDPDATVCATVGSPSPAREAEGGYVLSGRWSWASGSHHATWAIVSTVVGADGPAPDGGVALVPMSELSIENTWHMAGMRGTGSDTVVAEEVFVPAEHVVLMSSLQSGKPDPQAPTFSLQNVVGSMPAPVLGMGMAMYDLTVAKLVEGRPLTSGAKLQARAVDAPGGQASIADAAMLIDGAMLHAARSARAIDTATAEGMLMSPLAVARVRMDAGTAARQVRQAVETLLDVGGASRFADGDPAQRIHMLLGLHQQ